MKNLFYTIKPLTILLFINNTAWAQQSSINKNTILTDFVFKGNHIQLDFSGLLVFKARLEKNSGSYPVDTRSSRGEKIGFHYQINLNNTLSVKSGVEGTLTGRNIITSFKKTDFSPPLKEDFQINRKNSTLKELVLSIPIAMEKRWLYTNTKYFLVNGGPRLNWSAGGDFNVFLILLQDENNNIIDGGDVLVDANNEKRPWISLFSNVGHAWLLKNNNILQVLLISNLSFTRYVNGTFSIIVPNQLITTGPYSSNGSFIGLSVNYVFTNANYRIRKAYEKIKSFE